ncbi:toxic anion resistance protein [Kosakonia oryziphila]|uniref:Toxic anion resistance protein (TelA) n=1 Tax=Kosakonia oryziphila TaxID=1005667 RepID=A0A1C4FZY2_9ENTR|nr:toxic anion resistance protein [Kosakonia oryziphila]SCC61424.1 Toxic anion resistance protein (TelA) [Kosakonia oryziphila]
MFSLAFGAKTMNSISQFSESLMQEVQAKDAGVIGVQLTDLLMKIKQVDTITAKLNDAMVDLLRNISVLEILFDRNRDVFQQITLHIIAGKQKLEQIKQNELPALQAQAATDPMNAQRLRDLLDGIQSSEPWISS